MGSIDQTAEDQNAAPVEPAKENGANDTTESDVNDTKQPESKSTDSKDAEPKKEGSPKDITQSADVAKSCKPAADKPSESASKESDTKDAVVNGSKESETSESVKDSDKAQKEDKSEVIEAPKKLKNSRIYKLVTDRARKDDSGQWRMEVSNNFGKITATCIVKVLADADFGKEEIPSFVDRLMNEKSEETTKVIFRCKSAGVPEPEVKWYKNEIPIDDGVQYRISSYNGRHKLEIPRAHMRDMAIYRCKAVNRAGWAACDAKLYITEPMEDPFVPYIREREFTLAEKIKARRALEARSDADTLVTDFIDSDVLRKFMIKWKSDEDQTLDFAVHLGSKCAVEGSLVSLNCLVKGIAPFKVRWYKNDHEIYEGSKYFLRSKKGVLCLDILQTNEDDTGNYTCEVRNCQGKIYSSCYLQIEPMLDITNEVPMKPTFIKPMKRLTVNEGELIRFRVTVKGNPAPGFKWFKDAVEIHDSDRITTEMKSNGVAQLIIERANVRDIGLYTCEAHNMAGRARSMVRISVRDKFEMEQWKAKNTEGQDVETNIKTEGYTQHAAKKKEVEEDDYTPQYNSGEYSNEPMFTIQLPRAITIKDHERFILECCCAGTPKPIVKWFKDGQEVQAGPKVKFFNLGDWFGLEVVDALPGDAGSYMAKIINGADDMTSSCKVDMQLAIEYDRNIGTKIEIPQLISKEAFLFVAEQEAEIFDQLDVAEIVPSCNLCNTEIDWTATIEREVEVIDASEAPSFSGRLPDKITPVANQENIKLECFVKGDPVPQVGWLKDGEKLSESDRVKIAWDSESSSAKLTIDKPVASDSGKYTCVAFSEHGGYAESITIVEVKGTDPAEGKDAKKPSATVSEKRSLPEFKVKLKDMHMAPGSDLRLECKVEGEPLPKVTWYKNEQPITSSTDRCTLFTVKGVQTLKISRLREADGNTYRCEAVNSSGSVSSTSQVVVQEEPKLKDEPPQISTGLRNVLVDVGDRAHLQCFIKGVPVPKITWKKNGTDVTHKYRTEQSERGEVSLRIKTASVDDAGSYVCIAENSLGKVETNAALKVYDPNALKKGAKDSKSGAGEDSLAGAFLAGGSGKDAVKKGSKYSDLDAEFGEKKVGFIDYKRRPKFLEQPFSQWVMKNDPMALTFEVVKSEDMAVAWFHNDLPMLEGRFKIEVEDV